MHREQCVEVPFGRRRGTGLAHGQSRALFWLCVLVVAERYCAHSGGLVAVVVWHYLWLALRPLTCSRDAPGCL